MEQSSCQPENGDKIVKFSVSAPGKIILFGEHSVVYGETAIAASLNLRTHLHFQETNDKNIIFKLPAINYEFSIDIDKILAVELEHKVDDWDQHLTQVRSAVHTLIPNHAQLSEPQQNVLVVLIHLLLTSRGVINGSSGFSIHVTTELPIGSGVGSSASFSVVIVYALFIYQMIQNKQRTECLTKEALIQEQNMAEVFDKVYHCERILHHLPSGIDHTTSIMGSMVQFRKQLPQNDIQPLNTNHFKILLVNTKVPRSTQKLVQMVRDLKEKYPLVVQNVMKAMGCIAEQALDVFHRSQQSQDVAILSDLESELSGLMNLNHSLLRTLGVSHPLLEKVCDIATGHGLVGKLTGAGGGGNAIILVPSSTNQKVVDAVSMELTVAGFDVFETKIGVPGLKIEAFEMQVKH